MERGRREREREKVITKGEIQFRKKKKRLKNTGETYSTSIHSETKF